MIVYGIGVLAPGSVTLRLAGTATSSARDTANLGDQVRQHIAELSDNVREVFEQFDFDAQITRLDPQSGQQCYSLSRTVASKVSASPPTSSAVRTTACVSAWSGGLWGSLTCERLGTFQQRCGAEQGVVSREHFREGAGQRSAAGRLADNTLRMCRTHSSHSRQPRSGNPTASATLAEFALSSACTYSGTAPSSRIRRAI